MTCVSKKTNTNLPISPFSRNLRVHVKLCKASPQNLHLIIYDLPHDNTVICRRFAECLKFLYGMAHCPLAVKTHPKYIAVTKYQKY